ncbi:aldo/keto reductase [Kordia sp.]|uniref:aldo/keto reductase n=1 Tax=Kordia sp. TaxID=1965332 RepID=UPI003D28DB5A
MNFKKKVGLGTFPFSNVFSEVNQNIAEEIVDAFILNGGEYIETAPVYPQKNVDLGQIFKNYNRDKLYIASKCVTGVGSNGEKMRSGKWSHLLFQAENELKRLNIDKLDLLQSHIIPSDIRLEELGENLQKLKDEGFTKSIGVSNVDLYSLRILNQCCDLTLVQNRFSLLHQSSQRQLETFCLNNGIGLNPFQVIERGLLTTRPSNNGNWNENDLRSKKFEYNNEQYLVIRNWAEKELIPLAEETGVSLEKLVVYWVGKQPAVKLSVIGATKKEQILALMNERVDLDDNKDILEKVNESYNNICLKIKSKYNLTIEEFRGLV